MKLYKSFSILNVSFLSLFMEIRFAFSVSHHAHLDRESIDLPFSDDPFIIVSTSNIENVFLPCIMGINAELIFHNWLWRAVNIISNDRVVKLLIWKSLATQCAVCARQSRCPLCGLWWHDRLSESPTSATFVSVIRLTSHSMQSTITHSCLL